MTELILYLIESSLLLGVFYAIYWFALSRETFFQLNRVVLLVIPLLSLALPLVIFQFDELPVAALDQPVKQISKLSTSYHDVMASWEFEVGAREPDSNPVDAFLPWKRILLYLTILTYIVGVVICLSRTAWSIRWIVKLLSKHPRIESDGVKIVKLSYPTAPFSFLNYLFVHAPIIDSADFKQILDHELTHIKEKHTYDLFYVQLIVALFWFNPAVWLLLKSLKTAHEYIADRKIIESGYSVSEYQTLLLRQLISNNSYEFGHNFNLSFIKKRITMMTNKKSGWAGRTKVLGALMSMLFCSIVIVQCNSSKDDQISPLKAGVGSESKTDVSVPILPASSYKFEGDLSKAVTFTISNDQLRINGNVADLSEINQLKDVDESMRMLPVVMMVDKDQKMGFVRKVDMALRIADRRKLLYIGRTSEGERVEVMLMLPPDPKSDHLKEELAKVPEENLLRIDMSKNEGEAIQKRVYDFITGFIAKGQGDLPVVSAKATNETSYATYLSNFFHIKEAYIQIYQERSRAKFNKDFYKTDKEEYRKVREGVPMQVSIAEE